MLVFTNHPQHIPPPNTLKDGQVYQISVVFSDNVCASLSLLNSALLFLGFTSIEDYAFLFHLGSHYSLYIKHSNARLSNSWLSYNPTQDSRIKSHVGPTWHPAWHGYCFWHERAHNYLYYWLYDMGNCYILKDIIVATLEDRVIKNVNYELKTYNLSPKCWKTQQWFQDSLDVLWFIEINLDLDFFCCLIYLLTSIFLAHKLS